MATPLLVALVAVAPTMARAQDQEDGDRYRTLLERHKGDFDYLLGDWSFTARNNEYGAFHGVWSAVRLATGSGAHVMDEYRIVGDSGATYFVSSTLRVYNPVIDTWELISVHETSGLADRGTAQKVGNEMHLEQTFGSNTGRTALWHIRYYDIRADGFHWAADRSFDAGKTWERNYMTLEARRTGPARSLDRLTKH